MGIGYEPIKQTIIYNEEKIRLHYRARKYSILSLPPMVWYYYVLEEEGWRSTKEDAVIAAKSFVNSTKAITK